MVHGCRSTADTLGEGATKEVVGRDTQTVGHAKGKLTSTQGHCVALWKRPEPVLGTLTGLRQGNQLVLSSSVVSVVARKGLELLAKAQRLVSRHDGVEGVVEVGVCSEGGGVCRHLRGLPRLEDESLLGPARL